MIVDLCSATNNTHWWMKKNRLSWCYERKRPREESFVDLQMKDTIYLSFLILGRSDTALRNVLECLCFITAPSSRYVVLSRCWGLCEPCILYFTSVLIVLRDLTPDVSTKTKKVDLGATLLIDDVRVGHRGMSKTHNRERWRQTKVKTSIFTANTLSETR